MCERGNRYCKFKASLVLILILFLILHPFFIICWYYFVHYIRESKLLLSSSIGILIQVVNPLVKWFNGDRIERAGSSWFWTKLLNYFLGPSLLNKTSLNAKLSRNPFMVFPPLLLGKCQAVKSLTKEYRTLLLYFLFLLPHSLCINTVPSGMDSWWAAKQKGFLFNCHFSLSMSFINNIVQSLCNCHLFLAGSFPCWSHKVTSILSL